MIVTGRLNGSARFSACQILIGQLRRKPAPYYASADPAFIACAWLAYLSPVPTLRAQASAAAVPCYGTCHQLSFGCAPHAGVDCLLARLACAESSGDNSGGRGTSSSARFQPPAVQDSRRFGLVIGCTSVAPLSPGCAAKCYGCRAAALATLR